MRQWMKIGMAAAIAAAALLYGGCGGGGQGGKQQLPPSDKPIIGIVQIVQHGSLDQANKGFVDGLKQRGYDESKVTFDQQNAQGDQSNLKTIASRFASEKPKLICAIATPAAQAVANEIKDIPIVGTAITDYTTAKLVKNDENLAAMSPAYPTWPPSMPRWIWEGPLYRVRKISASSTALPKSIPKCRPI